MTACLHCSGSGVLNVEESVDCVTWTPAASACHACPPGQLWKELGL